MFRRNFLLLIAYSVLHTANAQPGHETIPDNVAAGLRWWNLLHYTIDITPDYLSKTITGSNSIQFKVITPGQEMEIDLQPSMTVISVSWQNQNLSFERKGDLYLVRFPRMLVRNEIETVVVSYCGHPKESVKPPWGEGGWIWQKDKLGRPWMSLSCESGLAATWLPSKNVLYDEPDSGITFSITVPDTLVAVANGRLISTIKRPGGLLCFTWAVTNPINSYDICPYIGKYASRHHQYAGLKGKLDCDYWALDYNIEKASRHLLQSDTMLQCFEEWMGPYPFYQDSYKVVEAPMAGMEHQSAIAYGNGFENGYGGKNLSGTTWGLKWDFILIHESGHEWFGNSITTCSYVDSWIHEGFTKYLEVIYTTYLFGESAGDEYALGIWKRIKNDAPIIGSGSSDEYNKGCALLHMIRQITGDSGFKKILRDLNTTFYHQTVNTAQILDCMNRSAGKDFSKLFEQYLTTTQIPRLEYYSLNDTLYYRWANCVAGFNMPVKVSADLSKCFFIEPATEWKQTIAVRYVFSALTADRNFYIGVQKIK